MKYLFLIFSFLLCIVFSTAAQPSGLKMKKQTKSFRDSSFLKNQPAQIRGNTNTQSSGFKAKSPGKGQQTKLDDLKNPFDTGKVKTIRRSKNYIGETEKN